MIEAFVKGVSGLRVVVGEANAPLRAATCHILDHFAGVQVVGETGDGQDLVKIVEQLQPDVVVVDVRMPSVSGLEAVRRIKKQSPKTHALVLTTYDEPEYVTASKEAGAFACLSKICLPTALYQAISLMQETA